MKKIILGIIIGGIIFTLGEVVALTMISSKNVTYQNKTVNNALDELYNEAITGKELVAAAITNKGITTLSSDSYETMATNISSIDTDHTEINQKMNNLESKHNNDISIITGSISSLNQSLTHFNNLKDIKIVGGLIGIGETTAIGETTYTIDLTPYKFSEIISASVTPVGIGYSNAHFAQISWITANQLRINIYNSNDGNSTNNGAYWLIIGK